MEPFDLCATLKGRLLCLRARAFIYSSIIGPQEVTLAVHTGVVCDRATAVRTVGRGHERGNV